MINQNILIEDIEIPRDIDFLIVEDEEDISEIIKEHLCEAGFKGSFIRLTSMEDAHSRLKERKKPFDFIISDWNLKNKSGLDLLKIIREIPRYKKTPFLMVTANDNVSGLLIASKKGATEYLVKPWEKKELLAKVAYSWSESPN